MALITREELLRRHYNGKLEPEVFDLLQTRYGMFRTVGDGCFDEHFLPVLDVTARALISKIRKELAAAKNFKEQTEKEKWNKDVAEAAAQLAREKHKHLRKRAAAELLKALSDDDTN